ncbi:hypothetical protein M5K25_019497 [Dendrobium thyrsiflorum]|uniref:Transmembrane protein n=1 Tax=Dendrobium thyrsiflorum TaxID=117978 RepID=A0ABD0UM04_DENTH
MDANMLERGRTVDEEYFNWLLGFPGLFGFCLAIGILAAWVLGWPSLFSLSFSPVFWLVVWAAARLDRFAFCCLVFGADSDVVWCAVSSVFCLWRLVVGFSWAVWFLFGCWDSGYLGSGLAEPLFLEFFSCFLNFRSVPAIRQHPSRALSVCSPNLTARTSPVPQNRSPTFVHMNELAIRQRSYALARKRHPHSLNLSPTPAVGNLAVSPIPALARGSSSAQSTPKPRDLPPAHACFTHGPPARAPFACLFAFAPRVCLRAFALTTLATLPAQGEPSLRETLAVRPSLSAVRST